MLLAVCLWVTYAVNISTSGLRDRVGTLKGVDFLQFYTAGRVVLAGETRGLYHLKAFAAESLRAVPQASSESFAPLYPPQVALLFAPLAPLSYGKALLLWSLISLLLYAICCRALWKACPNLIAHRRAVLAATLGYPAFFSVIAFGQISVLALVCFTVAFFALRSRHPLVAGLALGLLAYKPPLILAPAFILLLAGEWRVIIGLLASLLGQFSLVWGLLGTNIMLDYARLTWHLGELAAVLNIKLYQMHSLRAFWSLLLPSRTAMVLYLICAMVVVGAALRLWRSQLPLPVRYSGLLLATVLVSPHLYIYDLLVLAPALLLLADWNLAEARRLDVYLYLAYSLPLLGPWAARYGHLQVSVIVFAALLWCLSTRRKIEQNLAGVASLQKPQQNL